MTENVNSNEFKNSDEDENIQRDENGVEWWKDDNGNWYYRNPDSEDWEFYEEN